MKVWKISASDYVIGVLVNKGGNLDQGGALAAWNAQAGENYQGDDAEEIRFYEG